MADLNRLAILANELGINELADILDVSQDLLEKALQGEKLDREENALIDYGLSGFELDKVAQIENFINFDEIDEYAEKLKINLDFIEDETLVNDYRFLTANEQVELEYLDSYGLFANLTVKQTEKLIDWLKEDETRNASDFLNAYEIDVSEGLEFWDIENSAFWEWFREHLYK